ncbi:MAG TPA: GNAT family N-acetyltransferase [Pyrinomonadaceae bacterium]|nr:GNAT family N-acetyltransferase [Pyrinomonadaceae bacterium]
MHDISIRRSTLDDLDILLQFEQAIIDAERPFDTTIRSGPDVHYYDLAELIASPDAEVMVAELDSRIIASGSAKIERSDDYLIHREHSYLGFMYVVPEHRGKGVIKRIIGALEEWSSSRGITELQLEVYAANAGAVKAYEKSGYEGLILLMRKNIAE